jgi:hypothetical protein
MRFYVGLGVGHKYAHGRTSRGLVPIDEREEDQSIDRSAAASPTFQGLKATTADPGKACHAESDSQESSSGDSNAEYNPDDWDDDDDHEDEDWSDDEESAAMHEMYGA